MLFLSTQAENVPNGCTEMEVGGERRVPLTQLSIKNHFIYGRRVLECVHLISVG